ncbi:MAG: GntG family PLP-dependent aldolase [Phycisphaerae bacterium]|nr:GntG family PLP-dependent aldolase [Phycisphaerae bacterium]
MIDLRSDTVTQPTPEMRAAMAQARVGDDVFGEDPTVSELEERTAEILGKEVSVYVPSGTMSNQVGIRCHTQVGDEIFCDVTAHTYYYETGAPAALSGVMVRLLPGVRGIFTGQDVKAALRPRDDHFPCTTLVCVENTHNRGGGSIWPIQRIEEVHDAARAAGLSLHLDGARLWNASVATGIGEDEYAGYFDSVSVCFSKGLGAPVGSVLAGSAEFIERARRFRKMFGGAMRQVGIIAAGALYALEHHRDRLVEDHANAKKLASAIAELPSIELDVDEVETNIICFRVTGMPAVDLVGRLKKDGVWVRAIGEDVIRAVTNLMVSDSDIDRAIKAFRQVLGGAA